MTPIRVTIRDWKCAKCGAQEALKAALAELSDNHCLTIHAECASCGDKSEIVRQYSHAELDKILKASATIERSLRKGLVQIKKTAK